MAEQTIKVMIVDDHDMVRIGLKTYLSLESDIHVIGEAADGEQAIQALNQGMQDGLPDIILMDLHMPGMDGVATTESIVQAYPSIQIIMLTSFLDDEKVVKAVEAGAVNYVLKTISSEDLVAAIRDVKHQRSAMPAEIAQALSRGLRQRAAIVNSDEDLTAREKEVLLLIAEGKANKEIAEELHISIKTVKTHVSNLLMKCELEDRTQLAIYAHRNGLASSS